MRREISDLMDGAWYDYASAEDMLRAGRYNYVAFLCQQAVERMLKAAVMAVRRTRYPEGHNLKELVDETGLALPPELESGSALGTALPGVPLPERRGPLLGDVQRRAGRRVPESVEERAGMGGRQDKILRMIDRYIRELSKDIRVDRAILFGSHARGDAFKESDIDLVVISPDLANMHPLKRLEFLFLRWPFTKGAHILGYTPEEYDELARGLTLVAEVESYGKTVFSTQSA